MKSVIILVLLNFACKIACEVNRPVVVFVSCFFFLTLLEAAVLEWSDFLPTVDMFVLPVWQKIPEL